MLGRGISSYSSGSSDDSSLRMRLSSRSESASIAISRLCITRAKFRVLEQKERKQGQQPKFTSLCTEAFES